MYKVIGTGTVDHNGVIYKPGQTISDEDITPKEAKVLLEMGVIEKPANKGREGNPPTGLSSLNKQELMAKAKELGIPVIAFGLSRQKLIELIENKTQ